MNDDALARARRLSDKELLSHVKRLARHEREATAALVAHLAILDERRLFLNEGFASLFTYCVQVLHLSEHAAYNRIEVARAVRRFPLILPLMAGGSLNLTTVRLLAPHLTPANHEELLRASQHKGKREVEEIIAPFHPQPPVVAAVRMLPMTGAPLEGMSMPADDRAPPARGIHSPSAPELTPRPGPLQALDAPAATPQAGHPSSRSGLDSFGCTSRRPLRSVTS
jgi:hypothetical protein